MEVELVWKHSRESLKNGKIHINGENGIVGELISDDRSKRRGKAGCI